MLSALQVAVSVDSTCEEQTHLASVHFALLVDGLRTAGIWDRVRELHCSCERWLGPVRPTTGTYAVIQMCHFISPNMMVWEVLNQIERNKEVCVLLSQRSRDFIVLKLLLTSSIPTSAISGTLFP